MEKCAKNKKTFVAKKNICDLGFANVDIQRFKRRGFPEVIYCKGKDVKEIKKIAKSIVDNNRLLLLTRATRKIYGHLAEFYPEAKYNEKAQTISIQRQKLPLKKGIVLIVTGGTSDIPTAEEAKVTLELMGNPVRCLYDVGVAGIHRLLDRKSLISKANVIIVIAGMEGALASVVSGLVSKPVIAVPTSIGYGASFKGLAALLTMLNSCSPGIAVVNIDNGFGAGYFASLVNR